MVFEYGLGPFFNMNMGFFACVITHPDEKYKSYHLVKS